MALTLQPPLAARNGQKLQVLGIARISTEHQNALSLDDQEALYRRWLPQHTDLPFNMHMIAGRGSGEVLDRREALDANFEVKTGTYDLVIAEDLGRIFRRAHAQIFCELCEDYGTRLIALNDHVDTAQENWRVLAGFASMRHEMYNADAARRIRRTLRNRFQLGGVVQTVVFGYRKAPGTKSDTDLQKDPAAEPIYAEIFRLLEGGASYSEVSDWLNEKGIRPGPYVRVSRWNCAVVTRLIHNPILKGVRVRNRRMSKRVNQTGRHKSMPAPASERLERHCPHLSFIDPDRYDRLIALLDERNAKFRRKGVDGIDTRRNVSKKRTVWPGQHIDCGVCGRQFVYGGHGQKDHLMCQGARDYRCWNGFTVDGPLAAYKMSTAISQAIAALPDFDPVLLQMVEEEQQQHQGTRSRHFQMLTSRQTAVEREICNILAAIRTTGHSPSLMEELGRLESEKGQIAWDLKQLQRPLRLPQPISTIAEIKQLADEAFTKLAVTSTEFGRFLRRLIPRIMVKPFRLCDGGKSVLRGCFTLNLVPLVAETSGLERLSGALQRSLIVDLFEPPQREAFRLPVMELTANGLKQRDIAWELNITQTAVQRAVALARRMEKLGINDPYIPLLAPPDDDERACRHRNPRFSFEPVSHSNSSRQ